MSPRLAVALAAALIAAVPLAAQQRAPAAAPARPGAAPARPGAAPAAAAHPAATPATSPPAARPGQQPAADSVVDSTAVAIDYRREVYNYQGAARDPFASLLTDASVQTSINDLRLVGVLYDPAGRSVAVVRDKNSTSPHRLRRGDVLGRLRVIQIRRYEVVFQIEEFGFERQEVLTLQRPEVNR